MRKDGERAMNDLLEMVTSKQVAQNIVWRSTGPESLTARYEGEDSNYNLYVNSSVTKSYTEYKATIMKKNEAIAIYSDTFLEMSAAVVALCIEVAEQYNEGVRRTNQGIIMANEANQILMEQL